MSKRSKAGLEKILSKGRELMLQNGYNGTGIEDICKAAEVTKGAVFHYFKDKEELGLALLDYHWSLTQQMLASTPYATLSDPFERITAYVDLFVMMGEMPGVTHSCLFGNLTQELSETHERIVDRCAVAFVTWQNQIATDLAAAQRMYQSTGDWDAVSIAEHFVGIYEGALILIKARKEPQILSRSMRHFKAYLFSLFLFKNKKIQRR
jgi:TetR/AcrR family transcriptional regulator, transcriptional repressor for nem operon